MKGDRLMAVSERWFRLLLRLYPVNFRDEMGDGVVETYRDRARDALNRGGIIRLVVVWMRAFMDSLRNGPGERARPAASWRRSGNWGRDVELARRRLMRAPAFLLAVVGTLTVGLGMFTVVYTVVHKILIEAMPYKDPDDLYYVWRDYGPIFDLKRGALAGTDITELQKAGGTIESAVGLVRALQTFAVREDPDPTEIAVTVTSPNLFDVLGVQPSLGRGFARGEAGPGRSPVIVLTHHLWNRLGADRTIPGRVVRLNGEPYTVIGVMPSTFTFVLNAGLGPPQRVDAFTTFNVSLAETNPVAGSYSGLIRARRGTPPETVAAAVDAVGRGVDARDFQSRGLKLYPVGLKPDLVASVRPALLVLAFAGLILVLVLMVNLASVLLARVAQREHEFTVSRALGANGVAIIRATLFEGGLLGLIGGVLGALVATWGTRALVALAPLELPRRESIAVDWSIAAVVIALGVVLGLLAATGAATWAARTSLSTLLASSAVRGGGGGRGRMQRGMIVAQVALSLVLLGVSGLVIRSFERLLRADPGFRPEGLLTFRVPTPAPFFPQVADAVLFYDRVEQALAAIPGVKGVSAATTVPLTASARQATIKFPGAPGNTGDADRDVPLVDFVVARAGYIEVMGIRLLAGRPFEKARRDPREALIDATLARQFFPAGSPLGAKLQFGANADMVFTIVGVVEPARLHNVHQNDRPQVFVRDDFRGLSFVIRSDREPGSLIPEVRAAVRGLDPRIALSDVRTMDEIISDVLRQQRIIAVLIAAFALGALLLAAMGLFGVVSGSVTRRRHELAVRLALGADHQSLVRLVVREGALLVWIGVLIGVPGLYIAGGLIRGVLVGVSPSDPVTLVGVALGLLLITIVTCYVPARRALRIEPAQLLRQE